MDAALNAAAPHHLPSFVTAPGETDVLLVIVVIFLVVAVLAVGVFYFWLHSLPERMVHNKLQYDVVAVLALLSLFTHEHAFWIAGLLLAFVELPEFHFPHFGMTLHRIADSLEKISGEAGKTSGSKSADRSNTKHGS